MKSILSGVKILAVVNYFMQGHYRMIQNFSAQLMLVAPCLFCLVL